MTGPAKAPVDVAALALWMDEQGLPKGPIGEVVRLVGGTQNLLVRFTKGGRDFVLRQPPAHSVAGGGQTVRREARVLGALASTPVPHSKLIAVCTEEGVTGGQFLLMEAVEGFNVAVGMPPLHSGDAQVRRGMGLAAIEALAAIAQVDHVLVGLADFGKSEGFLERQVGRWRHQLASYEQYNGWLGGDSLPGISTLGKWLEDNRPRSFTPGLMHGDYHLQNLIFRLDGPQIAAVIDWELATIGDPLIDLAWLLANWPDPDGSPTTFTVSPWDGFPSEAALISYYGELTGRDLSQLHWYKVFACYKLAIILEGTYARSCAGMAPVDVGERLHRNALRLLGRATRTLRDRQLGNESALGS